MLNWIWLSFILVSVLVAGFNGKLETLTKGAFASAESSVVEVALPLLGLWALWLGMMRLAEQSGLVQILAKALRPVMRRLFPDVPEEHPAMGAMVLNMAANMLGLGNAASPLGLRAMAHLERLNPCPGVATNAMCTFLAINTASIQLVPTTAISILAIRGSTSPAAFWPAALLSSVCAAAAGIGSAKILERLPMFRVRQPDAPRPESAAQPTAQESAVEAETVKPRPLTRGGQVILGLYFAAFVLMLVLLAFRDPLVAWLTPHGIAVAPAPALVEGKPIHLRLLFSLATLAVPFLLSFFPLYAALRGARVYEQFVEGAKEAFATFQRVIPFLVAMLVSIRMLRDSGVLEMLQKGLRPVLDFVHFPADLLPLVLIRPLSGSATNGIFVELVKYLGPDTLTSRMAATIFGSTETTFYVIAVYFGAVAIRQTRHAIVAGLLADATAVVASVVFCRLLFT